MRRARPPHASLRTTARSYPQCSAGRTPGSSPPWPRAARHRPGCDTLDAASGALYIDRRYIEHRQLARRVHGAVRGARRNERERRSGSDVMQRTMLEAQALAKTIHELLVLAALRDGDKHGYQIALDVEERSEGAFVFQHGTLYPILHRLEAEKLIGGQWSGGEGQWRRKVYALTAAGRQRLEEGREWCRETFERLLDFL